MAEAGGKHGLMCILPHGFCTALLCMPALHCSWPGSCVLQSCELLWSVHMCWVSCMCTAVQPVAYSRYYALLAEACFCCIQLYIVCRGRDRSPSPHRRGRTSSRRRSRSRSRSRSKDRHRPRPSFLDMEYSDYKKHFNEASLNLHSQ